MDPTWSTEVDCILSVGRPLNDVGVRNWALERTAALTALEQLSDINVAVLGGDVYVVSGPTVEPNYDSWYCNRDGDESEAVFIARSIDKARIYILNYHSGAGGVLFSLVPSVVFK